MPDLSKQGVQPLVDFLQGKTQAVPRISKIDRCGLSYTDKVILITGATKGMGAGCAGVFVDAGAKVMICGRDTKAGKTVAEKLTAKGPGECVFEKCDVSQAEEIRSLLERTIEHFGRLDCLFNNAGYHPPLGPIDDFTIEDVTSLLQTNFVSQVAACKYALPHLRETRGTIINMGSCTGVLGQEGGALYAGTKGAISAFTKSLAIEEARNGVRVNAVLPGNIYTESRSQLVKDLGEKGAEVDRWAEANQPIGRSGTPEEVGQVVLFLATSASSYLTGIELMISSGIELGTGVKYPPLCL
jgi:NAD(P)-dependent dehydrogenase (short-subunit alcohol dehydrogenase family)